MKKKKPGKEQKDKQEQQQDREDLFTAESSSDEIDSDGSANAFEETETVTEDDFDNLSEK